MSTVTSASTAAAGQPSGGAHVAVKVEADEGGQCTRTTCFGTKMATGGMYDVPTYQRVPYVTSGYRINVRTTRECLMSIFAIHNETLNIWTHLIGFFVFVAMAVWWLLDIFYLDHGNHHSSRIASVTEALLEEGKEGGEERDTTTVQRIEGTVRLDVAFLLLLLFGGAFCMLASAMYHAFSCKHEPGFGRCLRLDLSGIAVQIAVSIFAGAYFGYACFPSLQKIYLILTAVLGVTMVCLPHLRFFQGPAGFKIRFGVLLGCGLSGLVPALHFVGIAKGEERELLMYIIYMGVLYLGGAALYTLRVPERWFAPGKFDILGHSHQWWHMCVFAAAFCWVKGITQLYYLRLKGCDQL